MKVAITKFFGWIISAAICIVLLTTQGYAAEAVISDSVPAVSEGRAESSDRPVLSEETVSVEELTSEETEADQPVYTDSVTGQKFVKGELNGTYKLSGYCNCAKCTGKFAGGKTAMGVYPTEGHTIAANKTNFPLGTYVIMNDQVYRVEDTGSGLDGNILDVYFDTHQEALDITWNGWTYADVYLAVPA